MLVRFKSSAAAWCAIYRGVLYKSDVLHRYLLAPNITQMARYISSERSKVEDTLKMLKEDLERQKAEAEQNKMITKVASSGKKLPLTQRIVHELKHYYHGFRLLALNTRISARYVWRLARGHSLTRRERQQLIRTVSDLLRLVPFSFFIIVPFMELALPIFIKIFPGMLPSTFQEASKEAEKLCRQVKVRIEMAKFLQDTLEELALERNSREKKLSEDESKAYEFSQFLRKVRTEGSYVSNADLFKYTKLFEDELTLDNLSMSQLRALCRILGVTGLGTPEILRFQLNMKLRELKADDKLIAAEGGVDSLSIQEVQNACRARGMRAIGVNEERLRNQLKQWLELSLSDKVPPSLLLLSRALYIPEEISFTNRLRTIISVLPEELGEQTRQKLTELEGGTIDPKERLQLIRHIEEGLKKERADTDARKALEVEAKKLKEEAKDFIVAEEKEADAVERPAETVSAAGEATTAIDLTAELDVKPEVVKATARVDDKVDKRLLESLEDILHGSAASEAKHDITELKEKIIEHTEDLIEVGSLANEYKESKIAQRLRARVNYMISGMDALVAKLESERQNIKEEITDTTTPATIQIKEERLMKIGDLLEKLEKLKTAVDGPTSEKIEKILVALDDDTDGQVEANLVLQVLELLSQHKDVEISSLEMIKIVELLRKENTIEALESLNASSIMADNAAHTVDGASTADGAALHGSSMFADLERVLSTEELARTIPELNAARTPSSNADGEAAFKANVDDAKKDEKSADASTSTSHPILDSKRVNHRDSATDRA